MLDATITGSTGPFSGEPRQRVNQSQLAADYGLTSTGRARIGANKADDDDDNPLCV